MAPTTAPAGGTGVPTVPAQQGVQRPPLIDSHLLLQGQRAVEISHNGELYRLQATRQGKLILTK